MKSMQLLGILLLAIFVNGCTTIVGATSDGPVEMDPNSRTFGTMIDDEQLETIVSVNIDKAHPDLKRAPVSVKAYNRVVLLTGQVSTQELRELAGQTAAKVDKVRQVHNELSVQAPIGFMGDTNDAWITTKVKTKLIANDDVRSSKVKVKTEAGVVFLMGLVSRTEAEKAAEVARGTKGVQKVVLAIEYTD